jgi:hypothetical protein
MDGFVMTVVECAKRIIEKDWEGIQEIDIKTLGYALIMVDTVKKNSK